MFCAYNLTNASKLSKITKEKGVFLWIGGIDVSAACPDWSVIEIPAGRLSVADRIFFSDFLKVLSQMLIYQPTDPERNGGQVVMVKKILRMLAVLAGVVLSLLALFVAYNFFVIWTLKCGTESILSRHEYFLGGQEIGKSCGLFELSLKGGESRNASNA